VRVELVDPDAVLLFGSVAQILPDALGTFRPPALGGQGRLDRLAVRAPRRDGGHDAGELGVHRVDVGNEALHFVVGETNARGTVVRDGPAVRLVPADRELHGPQPECGCRCGDRAVGDPVDPGRAEIGDDVAVPVAPHTSADAIASLKHDDPQTAPGQQSRRGQSCDTRPHDDRVDPIHRIHPLPGALRAARPVSVVGGAACRSVPGFSPYSITVSGEAVEMLSGGTAVSRLFVGLATRRS
jgi:hypothetical protein